MARKKRTVQDPVAVEMTPEQQQRAEQLEQRVREKVRQACRELVARSDQQLFGAGEFALRERILEVVAEALQAELEERKKLGK